MKKLTVVFSLLISLLAVGQPEALFSRANALYQAQDYQGAAAVYDSILAQGYAHQETHYNLGNCYYRMGAVGLAIVHYERSLRINPDDEDAKHNLALTQKKVVDTFSEVPTPVAERFFESVSKNISPTMWSILALVCGAAMLFFLGRFLFVKRADWLGAAAVSALVLLLVFEVMAWGSNRLASRKYAIIVAANTYVKSGPSGNATDLFILHEGTKVRVVETFEGWQKVRLPDGKVGWLGADDVETI